MKNFQGIHEAPPVIERSFKAATKLKFELPTDIEMETNTYETIIISRRYSCQNMRSIIKSYLDMQEFLGIDKALQSIQGELVNNTSKLIEIE